MPPKLAIAPSPVVLHVASDAAPTARPRDDRTLVPVRHGVWADAAAWRALAPWDRYLARVHAVALLRPPSSTRQSPASTRRARPSPRRRAACYTARRARTAGMWPVRGGRPRRRRDAYCPRPSRGDGPAGSSPGSSTRSWTCRRTRAAADTTRRRGSCCASSTPQPSRPRGTIASTIAIAMADESESLS